LTNISLRLLDDTVGEMKCEGENWIQIDRNTVKLKAIVNMTVIIQVPLKRGGGSFLAQGLSHLKNKYATQFDK
jgi:hypothetical protein